MWPVLVGRPLGRPWTAQEQITPVQGSSALSLDALTSVAYGAEAIVAIVVLLAILVFSYRQVIDAYPGAGASTPSPAPIWA